MLRPVVLVVAVCVAVCRAAGVAAQEPVRGVAQLTDGGPVFYMRSANSGKRVDARGAVVLKRRVSLHVTDQPLSDVLDSIGRASGMHIAYSPGMIPADARVSLHAEDITVAAALTDVLSDANVDVELLPGDQAALVKRTATAAVPETDAKQGRRITGRVLDAQNHAPVAQASVVATGTPIGTVTSDSGTFALNWPANATGLTVRRLGYRQATVSVAPGENDITVTLARDVLHLETQVVTGAATTISSRSAANAIAVVSDSQLSRVPAPTIENDLQGKIPGAVIQQNNGGAPGGGLQVQIRGATSIYANAYPLYVIDGVIVSNDVINSGLNTISQSNGGVGSSSMDLSPNRIADINPADIEDIQVLKGASASAIYGSQASAGVIIITTKKGSAGAPRWDFSQKVGHFSLENTYDLRTFPTLESAVVWAREYDEGDSSFIASVYAGPQNYQTQLFGNDQLSYESDLSVSGMANKTQYFVSGLSKYDNGTMLNTGYSKQSVRSNLTEHITDGLSITTNLTYVHSLTRRGLTGNDNIGASPYDVFAYTPQFVSLNKMVNGAWPVNPFGPANPFADAVEMQTPEEVSRFIGGGTLDWRLYQSSIQSLRFTAIGGADLTTQNDKFYAPPDLQVEQTLSLPGVSQDQYANNKYYNYSLNLIHHFTGLRFLDATTSLGWTEDQRRFDNPLVAGQDLLSGVNAPTAGSVQSITYSASEQKDQSLYAQEQVLTLDQRLALTAGVTAERSTNDGNTAKFYPFPRYSASYRVPAFSVVDELKLRIAYGQSGTLPNYGYKFTPLPTGIASGLIGPYGSLTQGDPNIAPEHETEVETGFDATLFHSRAQFSATIYQKQVSNLILLAGVSPSLGYNTEYINGGMFTNQGIELELTAIPIMLRNGFKWTSTTSFYRNYSVVNSLPVPAFNLTSSGGGELGTYRIQVGRSVTQLVGEYNGPDGTPVQVGDAQPFFVMNYGNELTWGPLRAYMLIEWSYGGNVGNYTDELFDFSPGLLAPQDSARAARRTAQAIGGLTPYAEGASYAKLRELTLSYALPVHWFHWLGSGRVSSVALALSGRNLFTWTRYTGLDPEVNFIGNTQVQSRGEVTPYPPARSYFLSLDVNF
jgi:TonB-dependent starch-binding outer membrane protein SusC